MSYSLDDARRVLPSHHPSSDPSARFFASCEPSSPSPWKPSRIRNRWDGSCGLGRGVATMRGSVGGVLACGTTRNESPHPSSLPFGSPPSVGRPGGGGGARPRSVIDGAAPEGPSVRLQGLSTRRGREEARGVGPPSSEGRGGRRVGERKRRRRSVRLPRRVRVRAQHVGRRTDRQRGPWTPGGASGAGTCIGIGFGAYQYDRVGTRETGTFGAGRATGTISRARITTKGCALWERWCRLWGAVGLLVMVPLMRSVMEVGAAFSSPPKTVAAPSFLGESLTIGAHGIRFRPAVFLTMPTSRRPGNGRGGRMGHAAHPEYLDEHEDDGGAFGDANVVLEDLNWRVEKLRLEERNTRQFLRSGPRFLPYEECRKWVQAWGNRWKTEDDWRQWIAMGEKRNPYIPSRPDEYYSGGGQWVSWEHFLGVPPEPTDATDDSTNRDEGESEL